MAASKYPRQFVRSGQPLGEWSAIEPYFDQLRDRPIDDVMQLNQWLLDCSELMACLDEVGTDRYVKMTCQTDDLERKRAYLDYVENIEPRCKPRWHELNLKYVRSPAAEKLPRPRFTVFDRSVRNRVDLFRDENVALQVDEAKLEQRFQELSGAMTVQFDGKEQTLQQLAAYGERTDRGIRQQAWETGTARRLQDRTVLEDIFDELFKLRHHMAVNTGAADYRAYTFKAKERFDYTAEDCLGFHDSIERAVVPAMRDLLARRKRLLALDSLRPWDMSVDVKGRPPLKPFDDSTQLCNRASRAFHRVHPDLGDQFDDMRRKGYLDLDSRKGKAPGGYQSTYYESRHPFIFMNAVGLQRDVRTLVHEGGHAFHAYACKDDPLVQYRSSPIEFAEVASMGMEMLAYDLLDEFYQGDDLVRAKQSQLEGIILFFPWMATIDGFQHWLYTHPDHSRAARQDQWLSLHERFGGGEDYGEYEEALAFGWQRQLHLYQAPFYYVEYGIAQLGALQVWRNARDSRGNAIHAYRAALALGGSRPLPDLFTAAGIRFDFSLDTLGPLIERVQEELEKLERQLMADLLTRTDDRILVLTLNRPDKRNALTHALIAELHQRIQTALADAGVGGVVITGAPPAFSAGLDLNEVAASRGNPAAAQARADALFDLLNGIHLATKPVVAAVNGACVAGGAGLMSACDLVVAGRTAKIGYPEIKRGLVAAIVMSFLLRQVGERHAKYLLLTGDVLDGQSAKEVGLVNEVVDDDRVVARAVELTKQVAAYPPKAYADTKHMLRAIAGLDPSEGMDKARQMHTQMQLSGQADAAISSFLAER